MTEQNWAIEASGLSKKYVRGDQELEILKNIDLRVKRGEAVSIVGASGAGKSTLLHLIGALDQPTSGEVFIHGKNVSHMGDREQAALRSRDIGFVFQFHHLLGEFTALENILMPSKIAGRSAKETYERSEFLIETLGLKDRQQHYPTELSGGEQQRVAIARALVNGPTVLLADEPSGNLDSENSLKIQQLFFDLQKEMGLTLVVVTHDRSFSQKFPRQLELRDGMWQ